MNYLDFDVIDSTNSYLKQNWQSLENLTFVSAGKQLKGKGRNSRIWESETDRNLLFSLLIKDESYFEHFGEISVLTAYSILQVLQSYNISNVSIKWPNDVYVNDDKICGILLEAISNITIKALIIGVGMNINQDNFNGIYRNKPVSLKMLTGKESDIQLIKEQVYQQLITNLTKMQSGYDFYSEICKYSYLDGKNVTAQIDGCEKEVKVLKINRDYSLKIICDHKEADLWTGEISFHK